MTNSADISIEYFDEFNILDSYYCHFINDDEYDFLFRYFQVYCERKAYYNPLTNGVTLRFYDGFSILDYFAITADCFDLLLYHENLDGPRMIFKSMRNKKNQDVDWAKEGF